MKGSLPLSVLMGFVNADTKGIDAQAKIPSKRVKRPIVIFCIQRNPWILALIAPFYHISVTKICLKHGIKVCWVEYIYIVWPSAKYVDGIFRLGRIGAVRWETLEFYDRMGSIKHHITGILQVFPIHILNVVGVHKVSGFEREQWTYLGRVLTMRSVYLETEYQLPPLKACT